MLYGFGDDAAPLPETLDLVEGIVLDYTTTLLHKVGGVGEVSAGERGWTWWRASSWTARLPCCTRWGVVLDRATAVPHKVPRDGGSCVFGAAGAPGRGRSATQSRPALLPAPFWQAVGSAASLLQCARSPAALLTRAAPACRPTSPPQAMDGAAARGKLRKPGAPGAGTAVGAEDILFLVRKVRPAAAAGGRSRLLQGLRKCRVECRCRPAEAMPLAPMRAAVDVTLARSQDPRKYARAKELLVTPPTLHHCCMPRPPTLCRTRASTRAPRSCSSWTRRSAGRARWWRRRWPASRRARPRARPRAAPPGGGGGCGGSARPAPTPNVLSPVSATR